VKLLAGMFVALSLSGQAPTYTDKAGIEYILIQPGSMQVGVFQPACPSPAVQDSGRGRAGRAPADPRTQWTSQDYQTCDELVKRDSSVGFTVNITKAFYLGKYEVTQAQWKKVMGSNPSVFQGGKAKDDADRHPVDSVTWADTQTFLKKLNAMEKSKLYRLPTEFEWEYAGRAGEPGQTSWNEIRQVAWEQLGSQKGTTQMVGTKLPNAWGLYDMLGNVWEWVADYYNEKLFADPVPPTKKGRESGSEHVLKGGGFVSDVKNVIYATHGAGPGDGWDVGFRVARGVK
jgi:formylglycine-generating enzyme